MCSEVRDLTNAVVARYRKLQKLRKVPKIIVKTEEPESVSPRAVIEYRQGLSLDVPKFDGKHLSWKQWWKTFSTVMKESPHLTEHSQQCHFVNAMQTPECKEYAETVFNQEASYPEAIEVIREYYKDCRMLHHYHYDDYHSLEPLEDNRASMKKYLDKGKATAKAFAECKVVTVGQDLTMYTTTPMDARMLAQWKKHTRKDKFTPEFSELLAFLKDQIKCLGAEEIVKCPVTPVCPPTKGRSAKKSATHTVLPKVHPRRSAHYVRVAIPWEPATITWRRLLQRDTSMPESVVCASTAWGFLTD